MLRFLADESCDFAVVRALRADGFDVITVAEVLPGGEDEQVIELAIRERRILLAEDKDLGGWFSRPVTRAWESCSSVLPPACEASLRIECSSWCAHTVTG